jgi:hypothetical protein
MQDILCVKQSFPIRNECCVVSIAALYLGCPRLETQLGNSVMADEFFDFLQKLQGNTLVVP